MKFIIILTVLSMTIPAFGEKILFLTAVGSKSHKNVFQPLISGMAKKGHDVTVVSPFKPSKEVKGIRELVPNNFAVDMENSIGANGFEMRKKGFIWMLTSNFSQTILSACEDTWKNEEFRELLNTKWDLIYINWMMNDCLYGFIHKAAAPFVIISTGAVPSKISSFTGNRLPPSFVPHGMTDFPDSMTFPQRLKNLFVNTAMDALFGIVVVGKNEKIYREALGQDLPSADSIMANVSAVFSNSHFALTHPRPTLPDVIEIGGMHCQPAKPLPKDIEAFVAGAEHGFIYFSLGSVVQANTMPEEMRKTFVSVFSKLKQKVLWKWETGEMPNLPANVKLLKWAPQQDILGHKKIKLFITHGGLLSTQEAAYHGVPLIGFPIFADQDLNMKSAERAGNAIALEILTLSAEGLEESINKILNNKEFARRAADLSARFRDQPETPLERAIFWSEYIIRHGGLSRSASRDLNFIQYHSIDVIATLTLILIAVCWLIKIIVLAVFRMCCGKIAKTKVKSQ